MKVGRVLVGLVAIGGLACGIDSDPSSQKLNVLFIAVDDLRPELGTYGAPAITPHIDQLAAEGIRFDRAYTEVAACAASRASLMTGAYSRTTGISTMHPVLAKANPALATMPALFKAAGYETFEIGKFQHNVADTPGAWSRPRWIPELVRPQYEAPENRHMTGSQRPRGPLSEAADVPDDVYEDGMLALRAIEGLRAVAGRPFFLALGFNRPHLPMNCPRKYWDLYDPAQIRVPDLTEMDGVSEQENHGSYELARYSVSAISGYGRAKRLIQAYRACASYIDAQVGLVLAELERLELAEKTIVVLWGDHGWHLGEHGVWGKFTLLEPSLRIPLIWRIPGRQGGRATSGLVETVDILPTLCELTGLEIPEQVEGISFVELIENPAREWKSAVFGSRKYITDDFPLAALTVRTPRFRLVRWFDANWKSREFELYDHESDPREFKNLANDPEYQTRIAMMNKMIDYWSLGKSVGQPR